VLSFLIDNLRVFLRFLLIPFWSSGDGFVVEGEDIPLFDSFGLVLGWIWRGYGDTSLHDFVPPFFLHELYFMTSYGMMYISTYNLFLLELSLFLFMMKHKGRHSNIMLGCFH
jgi:hypothetical protein